MRLSLLAGIALIGFTTAAADAALLTIKMNHTISGNVLTMNIYAKVDTLQTSPNEDFQNATGQSVAGGLRGFQFNVRTLFTGGSNYNATGNTATSVFPAVIRTHFAFIAPLRSDIGGDGDFDALGGSFSDTANFSKTDLGTPLSTSRITTGQFTGYELIATERWSYAGVNEAYLLTIIGPTYYDSQAPGTNYQSDLTLSSDSTTSTFLIPEPTTLATFGMAAMGLMARRRKS